MKCLLLPIIVLDVTAQTDDIISTTAKVLLEDNIGIQITPGEENTGSADIGVEVSLDEISWASLTLDPEPAIAGDAEPIYIDLNQLAAPFLRVTVSNIDGELDCVIKVAGKGLS